VPIRSCLVSFTDSEGIEHSVRVAGVDTLVEQGSLQVYQREGSALAVIERPKRMPHRRGIRFITLVESDLPV